MNSWLPSVTNAVYLIASLLFVYGIKFLSSPKTARQGNLLAAIGMLLAIVFTLLDQKIISFSWIIAGLLIGTALGTWMAKSIKMTAMPQMVALLNGFGGLSSLLVAYVEYIYTQPDILPEPSIVISLSIMVGGVTFTGSVIAFAKLQELMSSKAVVFKGQHILNVMLFLVNTILGYMMIMNPGEIWIPVVIALISLLIGVLVVIPIGGADMPVVISLLNSYSGIAAAMTGFLLYNNVLIISGALVGASGIILTNIMCKSMNRSLLNVLLGGFGNTTSEGPDTSQGKNITVKQIDVEEAAMLFDSAQSVIIVPGYGMAVAQAQYAVRDLMNLLEKKGINVRFAIHPVAGRMPGHMNVLLAEANVPYDKLVEMDMINDSFPTTDIALVLGANDVTNPAAHNNPKSPIFGMPILEVEKAKTIIVNKRSMKPGYAGIDNELYGHENCLMYFGDAKEAITKLVNELKNS